jgi:single-stranded-DNA-specific exonuclease
MPSFYERLLAYYSLSEQDYQKRVLPPSFSNIPLIDNDPQTLLAKNRLRFARDSGQKVLIYGDYDTDGIMSTSISLRAFSEYGLKVSAYLPSRYRDGYGLSAENVEKIAAKGFALIVTVDNGVTAYDALEKAKEKGIDVIIIDHHELGETKPDCVALIHPDTLHYGDVPVSAGYLSFLFSVALLGKVDDYLLSLGAISTLSDMMPLLSYNRELVRLMLLELQKHRYPEIFLLSDKSYLDEKTLQMEIIPKINAVGRLKEGTEINHLLRYFASDAPAEKPALAAWLNEVNAERKEKTKAAEDSLSFDPNAEAIVVEAEIPEGLNGLLANRLLQEYEKPVAVFSPSLKDPSVLVGSLRSKEGFNVLKALESLQIPLLSGGGHAFAGGISIRKEDFEAFKKDFIFAALKHKLTPNKEVLIPLNKEEATLENYKILKSFGPFGMNWAAPSFLLEGLEADAFTYLKGGKYLSLPLNKEARLFSFSLNEDSFEKGEKCALKVSFALHEYQGRFSLDLLAERP